MQSYINVGHSFAMGGILSISHDFRVMRSDRGWFCLPEVFLKMRFPDALVDLVRYLNTELWYYSDLLHPGQSCQCQNMSPVLYLVKSTQEGRLSKLG